MRGPNEEVATEEWKLLTSMDPIVRRIEILSGEHVCQSERPWVGTTISEASPRAANAAEGNCAGSPRKIFFGKTWKSCLSAAAPLFLVVQACYHILVTNLLGIFLRLKYSTKDGSLIFIEHALNTMIHCFVIIRILTFYVQSSEIHAMVDDVKRVHRAEQFDGEPVKSLLQNAQMQANRLHRMLKMALEVTSIVIFVTFVSDSIASGTIHFRGWYLLDVDGSPGFEITIFFLGFYYLLMPIILGQLDTFIICFLYNVESQFHTLCYNFEHIREQAVRNVAAKYTKLKMRRTSTMISAVQLVAASWEKSDSIRNEPCRGRKVYGYGHADSNLLDKHLKHSAEVDAEMVRLLGGLVGHHVALVRLTREFEKIFNPLLCCQIATNLFLTSLCVFFILKEGHLSNRLVLLLSLTFLLVSEKLIFCYLADNISTQSSRLRDCAFSCAWLRSSTRFNKSLRVVMSVANRELRVRVAGHVPLSMDTFAQITKFSWSMVTLAKSLTEPAGAHM